MCMYFKKTYKSKKEVSRLGNKVCGNSSYRSKDTLCDETKSDESEEEATDIDDYECYTEQVYQKKKFKFRNSHPGKYFSHLAELKKWVIPKV